MFWWDRTLEDADSGREVVHAAGSLESGSEDLDGGDEIVSEAVVQVALRKYRLASDDSVEVRMWCDGCGWCHGIACRTRMPRVK